jgi:hypothetical protein
MAYDEDEMQDLIKKYSHIWDSNPRALLEDYKYQPTLSERLDKVKCEPLNREALYEIVLWKLNRFPQIDDALISEVNEARKILSGKHRQAESLLGKLLNCRGVQLPMASTILRFVNPSTFQIVDDRTFRILRERLIWKKYPSKPIKPTKKYITDSIEVYFQYLDKLQEVCNERLPFHLADRIL